MQHFSGCWQSNHTELQKKNISSSDHRISVQGGEHHIITGSTTVIHRHHLHYIYSFSTDVWLSQPPLGLSFLLQSINTAKFPHFFLTQIACISSNTHIHSDKLSFKTFQEKKIRLFSLSQLNHSRADHLGFRLIMFPYGFRNDRGNLNKNSISSPLPPTIAASKACRHQRGRR